MIQSKPVEVDCGRQSQPKLGVKRLTLKQLFSANLGVDLRDPQRIHFNLVILITRGASTRMVDFQPLPLKACDLLLLRAGQVQAFAQDFSIEGEILTFTPEFVGAISNLPSIAESLQRLLDAGPRVSLSDNSAALVEQWYDEFSSELDLRGKPYSDSRIDYSFALLVTRLVALDEFIAASQEPEQYKSRLVREFISLLKENFLQHRDPAWYSKRVNASPRTLDRQLTDSLKKTCKQLINEYLVLEAKRLLTDPDLQIKDIAHSLRFEEVGNFSRFFHRNAGLTPRDFRSQMPGWPLETSKERKAS